MNTHYLPADAPILIIDDEFLVLWSLQDELEQLGFHSIYTASNVDASLAMVNDQEFSFAFLDVNLGDQKSFPIARALEKRGIPFAFVTGYGRAGLEGKFEEAAVIHKPVSRASLDKVVAIAH
jgi:DNA-binding NtrC family response regulator